MCKLNLRARKFRGRGAKHSAGRTRAATGKGGAAPREGDATGLRQPAMARFHRARGRFPWRSVWLTAHNGSDPTRPGPGQGGKGKGQCQAHHVFLTFSKELRRERGCNPSAQLHRSEIF